MNCLFHPGRSGPFVTVECSGVSEEVLLSELFGHDQGAFDGAVARRIGRIEEARGGTMFVREIGLMSAHVQARLFDMIREGGQGLLHTARTSGAARLIASSSSDLRHCVTEGRFRADLLNHLGMIEVALPSLRDRPEDIKSLALAFIATAARDYDLATPHLSDEAVALLQLHDWPGNVRELEAVMHRAVMLAQSGRIDIRAIVLQNGRQLDGTADSGTEIQKPTSTLPVDRLVGRSMADVERSLILQTLERCRGNRTTASSILGISVRTMRNKLRSFMDAGFPVAPF
jgi:DNA-binding NtrC family response regulator